MAIAERAEATAQRTVQWLRTDDGARWSFRAMAVPSAVVLFVAGRHQWFIRDDWAYITTRYRIHRDSGVADWLFTPQDGHWMTPPILAYRALESAFGLGSYWPFLLTALLAHLGLVWLVRVLCRRVGVSAWTTTLIATVLLVFGSGWENIIFGIQLTYNWALLGFLAQLLLTDHDGPLDRRDVLGLACGALGLMSSGFGPFFVVGIAVFLVARRRWRVAAFAAVPLATGYLIWWITYGSDPAADANPGGKSQVPLFAVRGLVATMDGLVTIGALGGIALFATLVITLWRPQGRTNPILVALGVTTAVMFLGIGVQRVGLGLSTASASRYVYMGAIMLTPALALAVDRLRTLSASALVAGHLVLATSAFVNAGSLLSFASDWSGRSRCEHEVLALLAGSPKAAAANPTFQPLQFSPDIQLGDLPRLVREHAFDARSAITPREVALVDQALTPASTTCVTRPKR